MCRLELIDGTVLDGRLIGRSVSTAGEVVFTTAMSGYPESISDPSYSGQILVFTYPMIGNYGVPDDAMEAGLCEYLESERPQVKGIVVADYSKHASHWNNRRSLEAWLKEYNIPGIVDIDTRALTQKLRDNGSLQGRIIIDETVDFYNPDTENQVAKVSCQEVREYGAGDKTVVVVDCGVKHNILRCLVKRGVHIIRVPWDYDFSSIQYDGLLISNGPGDPSQCAVTVAHIRKALSGNRPIFGICMGNQLLARAGGAETYKLKFGHRGHNQPVREVGTNKCFITSQNHGFAVDTQTLSADWKPLFENMNDGTNEGIQHISKPFFSTQFHPEASGGPTDTEWLFDKFVALL